MSAQDFFRTGKNEINNKIQDFSFSLIAQILHIQGQIQNGIVIRYPVIKQSGRVIVGNGRTGFGCPAERLRLILFRFLVKEAAPEIILYGTVQGVEIFFREIVDKLIAVK